MPPTPRPLAERFWSKVDWTPTCWLWTASTNNVGYGKIIGEGGRGAPLLLAHRVAYELLVGPIPAGFVIDHLCRTPACVNTDHLEAVTFRENLMRGDTVPARNAAKTHCPRGHRLAGANLVSGAASRHCDTCRRVNRARRDAERRTASTGT